MYELHDLKVLIKSKVPIIIIETHEEHRVLDLFKRLHKQLPKPLFQWKVTEGLRRIDVEDMAPQSFNRQPIDVLKHIHGGAAPGIYLLLDFHPYLEEPLHVRLVKEIALARKQSANTLVFVCHSMTVPPELEKYVAHFKLRLPSQERIKALILREVSDWQKNHQVHDVIADPESIDLLAANLVGMPEQDAIMLMRYAIANDGVLSKDDIAEVSAKKYDLFGQGGALSFESETAAFDDVAGMSKLKDWLAKREKIFLAEKAHAALDRPKGIMLIGVQGGGKSLAAKSIAGGWRIPLLRLDFAALYNKFIGETEKNLRSAIQSAEAMSPCVLWIDEIEKGINQGDDATGTSQRILGTLLTWLAERDSRVFLAVTANNIEALPPELIRKGRLDEIFFVDLPNTEIRQEIFRIHLDKRKIDRQDFDLAKLASMSEGFSGAEIEQAVVSALYAAHADDSELKQFQLIEELLATRPLSVIMREKMDHLRAWASDRTVSVNE